MKCVFALCVFGMAWALQFLIFIVVFLFSWRIGVGSLVLNLLARVSWHGNFGVYACLLMALDDRSLTMIHRSGIDILPLVSVSCYSSIKNFASTQHRRSNTKLIVKQLSTSGNSQWDSQSYEEQRK